MPSTPQDRKTKRPAAKSTKTTKPASYGSGWKTPLTDLQLPSGEMCQVKRSGVQGMMKAGVLDSVDSLTAIVQGDTIPKAQGKRQIDVKSVMADGDAMTKILSMVDRIVIFSVVQPQVHSNYVTKDQAADSASPFFGEEIDDETGLGRFIEFSERDADKVYVDYIDEVDRMFIMNFVVGGSSDLERFREETEALMGGVSAGEAAEDATE